MVWCFAWAARSSSSIASIRAEACLAASANARVCCLSCSLAARLELEDPDGRVGDDGL